MKYGSRRPTPIRVQIDKIMGNGIRDYDLLPVVNKRIVDNSLGDGFWSDYRHSSNNDFQTMVLATFHPELEGWVLLVVVLLAENPEYVNAVTIVRIETPSGRRQPHDGMYF
jgi:hypothetical protein